MDTAIAHAQCNSRAWGHYRLLSDAGSFQLPEMGPRRAAFGTGEAPTLWPAAPPQVT